MCEVEFGVPPATLREMEEHAALVWAHCVYAKAAERPGEWCRVSSHDNASTDADGIRRFAAESKALYTLKLNGRWMLITQKLGVRRQGDGELWILVPRTVRHDLKTWFRRLRGTS